MERTPKKEYVSISNGTILRVMLFIVLAIVLFMLRDLVLVLLTSIVIASFSESAVQKFRKWKIPRSVTVIGVYLLTIGSLVAIFYVFAPIFADEITKLVTVLADYIPKGSILQNLSGDTISNTKTVVTSISQNATVPELINNVQSLVSGVSGGFLNTTSFIFGGVFNVVLIMVISFYLSMQERGIENFLRIVTPAKNEAYAIDLWRRTERKIGLWIQGQLLLGALIGVLIYLGLLLFNVPYALVTALLAAIFELIPFGLILAIIPALGFAYIGGGFVVAIKVLGLYVVVQQFENYLIAPLIVKKVIGISPLVVILSLLVGFQLAGFWGIILAIPVAVCLLEMLDDMEKKKYTEISA